MKFGASASLLVALCASTVSAHPAPRRKHIEVQGHRGGTGMVVEETAYAYAYAMEAGVDVLEMDALFTKDGVPVIWHDHKIYPGKCKDTVKGKTYVGKFVADLTLAELKTLDCGSLQDATSSQQKLYPGAKIQTLEEILDLIDCYGNKKVKINLETKLDPVKPEETKPVSKYINDLVPILKRRGYAKRTMIQSFDWRTIIGIKKKFPEMVTIALLDDSTIIPVDRGVGGYPWLGGIDLDALKGDYVKAAKMAGASILSPNHSETISSTSVNGEMYKPFTTEKMVSRAHKAGLKVVPWTVNDESTMQRMYEYGVDGIISDYPERALWVARKVGFTSGIGRSWPRKYCLKTAGSK